MSSSAAHPGLLSWRAGHVAGPRKTLDLPEHRRDSRYTRAREGEGMSDIESRMASLGPEARARVDEAMRAALEKELLAGGPGLSLRGEFSRGLIFSRSRPAELAGLQETVIQQAGALDDETFAKFATRLRQLKETGREAAPGGGS
jgi:hypothetical protein